MQKKDWDFHDEFSDQYILIENLLKKHHLTPVRLLPYPICGIVPKSDGVTWRLISHLSYSTFNGINDFIILQISLNNFNF
jgi:hypothetical protein